ncbi:hypothetical protein Y694_03781 [Methylibium sp. T29-B]|nr:hypothetical protein Y694_03781 [Methylibium sp. T29-B]
MSACSCRIVRSTSGLPSSRRSTSMSGWATRKRPSSAGRYSVIAAVLHNTRTLLRTPWAWADISACRASMSRCSRPACRRSVRPASVGTTPCFDRTSSAAPRACSRFCNRVLAADSDRCISRAPAVIEPASATAPNRRRSNGSMRKPAAPRGRARGGTGHRHPSRLPKDSCACARWTPRGRAATMPAWTSNGSPLSAPSSRWRARSRACRAWACPLSRWRCWGW